LMFYFKHLKNKQKYGNGLYDIGWSNYAGKLVS
jgi:hypothetical protein